MFIILSLYKSIFLYNEDLCHIKINETSCHMFIIIISGLFLKAIYVYDIGLYLYYILNEYPGILDYKQFHNFFTKSVFKFFRSRIIMNVRFFCIYTKL